MATPTTKQKKNKALNPREPASELPSALEISARDTLSLGRLELLGAPQNRETRLAHGITRGFDGDLREFHTGKSGPPHTKRGERSI
jgi:hypothetical protein